MDAEVVAEVAAEAEDDGDDGAGEAVLQHTLADDALPWCRVHGGSQYRRVAVEVAPVEVETMLW